MPARTAPVRLFVLLLVATALAGCHDEGEGDERLDAPNAVHGTTGLDETAPPATKPPPKGELGRGDISRLAYSYSDQPFQGGQGSPGRVSKWVSEDTFIGFVVDDPDPANATAILWITLAKKGVFCDEARPRDFPHFHPWNATSWEAGEGGDAGAEGYWILYIAVVDIPSGAAPQKAPWGPVRPGLDTAYPATPAPTCGADVPEADFTAGGEGKLAGQGLAALIDAFSDQPFQGGQASPGRIVKYAGPDSFIFLLFNEEDPQVEGVDVLWYGLGSTGRACVDQVPGDGFTHFHKWDAPTWPSGHGGTTGAHVYWLLHAAVRPLLDAADGGPAWGPVAVGVDRDFMPTPVEGGC